jgi:hypothetical protein
MITVNTNIIAVTSLRAKSGLWETHKTRLDHPPIKERSSGQEE